MSDPVGAALDALGDPTRRDLYERILARPSRIYGLLVATVDPLPQLRTYFDRLWFEASVGEGWLRERFAMSRRLHALDAAPPLAPRSRSA